MSMPASTFGWSAYLRIELKTSKVDGEEFTMESGSPAISSMAEEREESMEDVRREGISSSAEIWYNDGSERVSRCSWSVNSAIAAGVDGDEKWKIFMAFERGLFSLFCLQTRRERDGIKKAEPNCWTMSRAMSSNEARTYRT